MTGLLIRDVPDDVPAAMDARAQRLGLSRSEYLHRALARERVVTDVDVTVDVRAVRSHIRRCRRRGHHAPGMGVIVAACSTTRARSEH